ncbi:MAG: hypothetical protein AAF628_07380 [Planctomycetota bacterium]
MFEVASDQSFPRLQQISFFLPNKVGSLQRVIDVLDQAKVSVCGLSILDAHDHAVVRIIVDNPEKAIDTLGQGGRALCTTQLIGVAVPAADDAGVGKLLGRLLRAELNVYYAYALIVRHQGRAIMALHADDLAAAAAVLRSGGIELVDQRDLVDSD